MRVTCLSAVDGMVWSGGGILPSSIQKTGVRYVYGMETEME